MSEEQAIRKHLEDAPDEIAALACLHDLLFDQKRYIEANEIHDRILKLQARDEPRV